MLRRIWFAYLKVWPHFVKTRFRLYSLAIFLGLATLAGTQIHSWLSYPVTFMSLVLLFLLAIPEYFIPWD